MGGKSMLIRYYLINCSYLNNPTLVWKHDGLYWPVYSCPVKLRTPSQLWISGDKSEYFQYKYYYPWRRQWHPTPVLFPGKSHGRRSLEGCSPWGLEESDTTERLHFHFSLSCIGEGNGNPLQCSCLENPRDRGAWWATVCGVTQSQTRLKRLSSSSSNQNVTCCLSKIQT